MYLQRLFQCSLLRSSVQGRPKVVPIVASSRPYKDYRSTFTTQSFANHPYLPVKHVLSKENILSPPVRLAFRKLVVPGGWRYASQVQRWKKLRSKAASVASGRRATGKIRTVRVYRAGFAPAARKSTTAQQRNKRTRLRKEIRRRSVPKGIVGKLRRSLKRTSRQTDGRKSKRSTTHVKPRIQSRRQKAVRRIRSTTLKRCGQVSRSRVSRRSVVQQARSAAKRLKRSFSNESECVKWYQDHKATQLKKSFTIKNDKELRRLEKLEAKSKVGLLAARRFLRRHRSQVPVEVLKLRGNDVLAAYNELASRLSEARDLKAAKRLLARIKKPEISLADTTDSEILLWYRKRQLAVLRRRAVSALRRRLIQWSPTEAPDRLILLWGKYNFPSSAHSRSRATTTSSSSQSISKL